MKLSKIVKIILICLTASLLISGYNIIFFLQNTHANDIISFSIIGILSAMPMVVSFGLINPYMILSVWFLWVSQLRSLNFRIKALLVVYVSLSVLYFTINPLLMEPYRTGDSYLSIGAVISSVLFYSVVVGITLLFSWYYKQGPTRKRLALLIVGSVLLLFAMNRFLVSQNNKADLAGYNSWRSGLSDSLQKEQQESRGALNQQKHSFATLDPDKYELINREYDLQIHRKTIPPSLSSKYKLNSDSTAEIVEYDSDIKYSVSRSTGKGILTSALGQVEYYNVSSRIDYYVKNNGYMIWILSPNTVEKQAIIDLINDFQFTQAPQVELLEKSDWRGNDSPKVY